MRKILTSILFATLVIFSGCASKFTSTNGNNTLSGQDISAYLIGEYIDVKNASAKLTDAGYEVIATYSPVKKGTTIVFTNQALKTQASKPGRSNMAVLRLFVDDKEKMISITNPVYFGKAFMQDDYNHKVFNKELKTINKAFVGLKTSVDKLKFDDLADFHFMMGMPYYNEPDKLAKGTAQELLKKASDYKKGKLKIFEIKLSDNSYLLGYELGKRTKKFVKKVGRANASILPWCITIENGTATALNAKYYIAISYPLFTMSQFMGIATVPDAIKKDLAKAFK